MSFKKTALAAVLSTSALLTACGGDDNNSTSRLEGHHFNRIATFLACSQIDTTCNDDTETVAEIVAASSDGMTLIYTDSPGDQVGFVDISQASSPSGLGFVNVGGEPTSVAVKGDYALVGVNTSSDFINVSGVLKVIEISTRAVVQTLTLGGQPDSVAVSPDGNYAAIAIENERDEDLGSGAPPQLPAGSLDIIDTSANDPANWTVTNIAMTGLAGALYANDPEPEYVDINSDNIAVVTLQENNAIALVDLASKTVTTSFTAGSVNLTQVDATEEDPALIMQNQTLSNVLREPDGVSWISTEHFITANEGDLDGGSRGFSVLDASGDGV